MCRGCGPQIPNQPSSYRCHLILFRIAVCHDHQVGIRQGPLPEPLGTVREFVQVADN
jgi:hypothetical protein